MGAVKEIGNGFYEVNGKHSANVRDKTCSCTDKIYRLEHGEFCKHLSFVQRRYRVTDVINFIKARYPLKRHEVCMDYLTRPKVWPFRHLVSEPPSRRRDA